MNGFGVPASFDAVSTRADKSLSLRFTTQELTSEDKIAIMENVQTLGYVLFAEKSIDESEIPVEPLLNAKSKNPVKRLRLYFYREWKRNGEPGTFAEYFETIAEKFIAWREHGEDIDNAATT